MNGLFDPLALLLACAAAPQQPASAFEGRPEVYAMRLAEPVIVDGALDERVWREASEVTRFVQLEPVENSPASFDTEVRIAYDDHALYVGARMRDPEPGAIVTRLGRRDESLSADEFVLYLDPYHDRRSGFFFSVNAAGTLRDGTLLNDDWDDADWDGVWQGRAQVDGQGWTVEIRVPYSQLRFLPADKHRWGINLRRYVSRSKEDAYLVVRPKDGSGFVSRFHDLVGIESIRPPRRFAALPYLNTRGEFTQHATGDPFNDGSRVRPTLGADFRLALGSSLSLDATVNPDFGQVEVDPAVVNLTDVETFFLEKRPFFVEGSNVFIFGSGGASSSVGLNWTNPEFFYSRRIGRAPRGAVPESEFADVPAGVSIVGAAKLTGRVAGGWKLGVVQAVTAREFADVSQAAERSRVEVEPSAYYGVFRAQRDFPSGRRGLGLMATTVARRFDDASLQDLLSSEAFSLGLDGWTFLDTDKRWVVTGWGATSHVRGSAARITALQQSGQHYFQRPDAGHVDLDPTAEALSGFAGRAAINKEKGNLLFNAALGAISPGFELNDLGFQERADLLNASLWGGYRWTQPGPRARSARLQGAYFESRNFDGNTTWRGVFGRGELELLNYWRVQGGGAFNAETLNTTRTRGGPLTLNPPGWEWNVVVGSDDRKNLLARAAFDGADYARGSQWNRRISLHLQWQPRSHLLVSLTPRMEWSRNGSQYLATFEDPLATATFGKRYVFARLAQRTFAAALRLHWTFDPRLSLQVYAQPLVSSGDYSDFGELARPRSYEFLRYGGDAPPASLDNPDFNFKSLRGTAVLRWEFRPGSTAYFVWTQTRSEDEPVGEFQLRRNLSRLFDTLADNIFLVKITYWWSR